MSHPIKIGIIGCGNVMIGPYMSLIQKLDYQGQVKVVAACDSVADKRQFVQQKFGIPRTTANYQEIIEDDDVELVMVLTSMPQHGPLAQAALEAGKHVLVEKPMAVTLPEAAHLVELAKTSPGYLVCAPHIILSPTFRAILKRIRRGDIGRVVSARALYGWAGPWWGQWFYQPGGGSLFDLGVYNVTSLTGLLGPARRVMAMTGVAIPERVVDGEHMQVQAEDNAHVLLDFGDSVFAVVTTGFTIQKYRCPAIELYGTQGTLQMMGDDWDPEGYELWQNEVGAWQVYEETDPNWPWTDGLRHLVECIQTGTPPLITPEHAYHVLEIMLKVQESGRDGREKIIDSRFTLPELDPTPIAEASHLAHDRSY
ncbi:MAG: Gfo/Idh/MocA family oxidoreductase [Anaerolineae bacterium]|nr:Gfo/Idh/MocA family oxidoreductase [Anaerolineae bacterium]